jgi:hypothetical protein
MTLLHNYRNITIEVCEREAELNHAFEWVTLAWSNSSIINPQISAIKPIFKSILILAAKLLTLPLI